MAKFPLCPRPTVNPAVQFCCGCSLSSGVKFVCVLHLIGCLYYCISSFASIVLKMGAVGGGNPGPVIFMTGFCLAGLPLIASGLYGARHRLEPPVRVYFWYFAFCALLDMTAIVYSTLFVDQCTSVGSMVSTAAKSFVCGAQRIFFILTIAMLLIVQLYILFVIWSYCEELREVGGGQVLADLLGTKEDMAKRRYKHDHHFGSLLHAGAAVKAPFSTADYDAVNTVGFGGNVAIFGGDHHETSFPPEPVRA